MLYKIPYNNLETFCYQFNIYIYFFLHINKYTKMIQINRVDVK